MNKFVKFSAICLLAFGFTTAAVAQSHIPDGVITYTRTIEVSNPWTLVSWFGGITIDVDRETDNPKPTPNQPGTSWIIAPKDAYKTKLFGIGDITLNLNNSIPLASIQCTNLPSAWRVWSIEFKGGKGLTKSNGSYATANVGDSIGSSVAASSANQIKFEFNGARGDLAVQIHKGSGKTEFVFNEIVIVYSLQDPPPTLLYFDDAQTPNNSGAPHQYATMPTAITAKASVPVYINASHGAFTPQNVANYAQVVDVATNLAVPGAVSLTTYDGSTGNYRFSAAIDESKLNYCGSYVLRMGTVYNSEGTPAQSDQYNWFFNTPNLTSAEFTITPKHTIYQYSSVTIDDVTITRGGVDVTAECTGFSVNTNNYGNQLTTFNYRGCSVAPTLFVTQVHDCVITFDNDITGESLPTRTVYQGFAIGTLPTPAQTNATSDCGQLQFVGWSTRAITAVGGEPVQPTIVSAEWLTPAEDAVTLYAVYRTALVEEWQRVNTTAELNLQDGKDILIASADEPYAMSSVAKNNIVATEVTCTSDVLEGENLMLLRLTKVGESYTLQLPDDKYLAATSSTSNLLQGIETAEQHAHWNISFSGNVATIVANGSFTRKNLRFNTGNSTKLFSCYASGQKDVSIYKLESSISYMTTCSCTPLVATNLSAADISAQTATLSWNTTTGARAYAVEYRQSGAATWTPLDTTDQTTISLSGLVKNTTYQFRVKPISSGAPYCLVNDWSAEQSFITTSGCTMQIDYQSTVGGALLEGNCMVRFSGNEYRYQITLPAPECEYRVSQGATTTRSQRVRFDNPVGGATGQAGLTFAALRNSVEETSVYPGEGAVGWISAQNVAEGVADNYRAVFVPEAYQIHYGTLDLPFAKISGDTYETAVVDVPADFATTDYYVGAKKSDGTTAFATNKSAMAKMNTMTGLNIPDVAGSAVKYRILENSNAANWKCRAITMYNLIYYNADKTTEFERSPYFEATAGSTITVTYNRPTKPGFQFIGWNESGNDQVADYFPGDEVPRGTNKKLYPVFKEAIRVVYVAGTGATTTCETDYYVEGNEVIVCWDVPTKPGYQFAGWTINADGSGTKYQPGDRFTMPNAEVTLYAQFRREVRVYYDLRNATLPAACTADYVVLVGDQITLCAAASSDLSYIFSAWKLTKTSGNEEIAAGGTYTVVESDGDIKIEPVWTIPTYTYEFINRGDGTEKVVASITSEQGSVINSPNSCGEIPINCEGKQFVGWAHLETQFDGSINTENEGEFMRAAGLESGEFIHAGDQLEVLQDGVNAGKWYAVFAIPN